MPDMLDRIDNVLDQLCPCGAQPAPGSAYCGYDCTPTHHGIHTTSDRDGTPMRWRPDLVTAHDDSGLTLLEGERNGYEGRHNATVYERTPDIWHLRLDDGHRYVGVDVEVTRRGEILDETFVGAVRDGWSRLERELGNSRHLEPDTQDCQASDLDQLIRRYLGADSFRPVPDMRQEERVTWRRLCVYCGERATPITGCRAVFEEIDIMSFGRFEPVREAFTSSEPCDLCGSCRRQFPGPPLQAFRREGTSEYRLRLVDDGDVIGVRRYLTGYADLEFDEMERQVLDEYARRNPDRGDVIDWVQARNARDWQIMTARQWYLQDQRISAMVVDPRSFLRGLTIT